MKKIFLSILLAVDVLALVVGSVGAAFIRDYGGVFVTDGFGRVLVEAPAILRRAGVAEVHANFLWTIADIVIFWVLVGVAAILYDAIVKD